MSSKQKRRLKNKRKLAQLNNNKRRIQNQNPVENVVLDESIKKPFTEKVNYDTANQTEIDNVNYSLIDYLSNTGEANAALHVQNLMLQSQPSQIDVDRSDDEYSKRILKVNSEILSVLRRIQQDAIDEQDTDIKFKKYDSSIIKNNNSVAQPLENTISLNETSFDSLSKKTIATNTKNTSKKTPKTQQKTKPLKSSTPKTSKTPKKIPSGLIKGASKSTIRAASKFLGPAALLIEGAFITYDALQGWDNAANSLGIDEKDLTLMDKSAASMSSVINGITFGLADENEMNTAYKNMSGKNDVINRYDDQMGIIDYDVLGNSEVEDWDRLASLSPVEIQKIIEIDDWSKDDKRRLEVYKDLAEKRQKNNENQLIKDVLGERDENDVLKQKEQIENDIKDHVNVIKTMQENFEKAKKSNQSTTAEQFQKIIEARTIKINELSQQYNELDVNKTKKLSDYHKNVNDSNIKEYIKQNEGLRLKPYADNGHYAIGYGHQIKNDEKYLMNGITKDQAEELFEKDFIVHKKQAEKIPGFSTYSKAIQNVLIDMTYNMGGSWYKNWPNTMEALKNGDYQTVATNIVDSKYANDVGKRALTNASIFYSESDDTSFEKIKDRNAVVNNVNHIYNDNKEISNNALEKENIDTSYNKNNKNVVNAETDKTKKEQIVVNDNKQLTKSHRELYLDRIAEQEFQQSPNINSNITNISTNSTDNERLLNLFT